MQLLITNNRQPITKRSGFTLIELLVVALIIMILAGIVMVNLEKANAKSRDTQRKANLSEIATALETYKADKKSYIATCADQTVYPLPSCPLSGGLPTHNKIGIIPPSDTTNGILRDLVDENYISFLPKDPSRKGTDPSDLTNYQYYIYNSNGQQYKLTAQSETIDIPSGQDCKTTSVKEDAKLKAGDFYDSSTDASCSQFQVSSDASALNIL